MPNPTISRLCRDMQSDLSTINVVLAATIALAQNIGLAPFRIANLRAAHTDNEHAWQELNAVATALEITGPDLRDSPATAPAPAGP